MTSIAIDRLAQLAARGGGARLHVWPGQDGGWHVNVASAGSNWSVEFDHSLENGIAACVQRRMDARDSAPDIVERTRQDDAATRGPLPVAAPTSLESLLG